ncbi:hypothetical protein H2241_22635 [Pantoea ananatis]|nr:hypothetical protein [Pantoea ananatis]QKV85971.1 hypothetical protein FOB88_01870 [Pantoea ananatis]
MNYLKALCECKTPVVLKLERLGHDLHHLINMVHDLTGRGIELKILIGHKAAFDTTTVVNKS